MKGWNAKTGYYQAPSTLEECPEIPEDSPDVWLSKPDGSHFLGMSFHFAPYNFPEGKGKLENRFVYSVAPYHLNVIQDPYNSWKIKARLSSFLTTGPDEYWDWLPGILIVDVSAKYSLPDTKLSVFAGSEWADSDFRVFCGLWDLGLYDRLVRELLRLINRLTGPGWAGWPFGQRQLAESVIVWVNPETMFPELLLLASVRQFGVKHSYWNQRLYHPGEKLGGWEDRPKDTWDCRRALRFLYQAKIMLADGLPEMALSASIASLENATAEILLFLLNGNSRKVETELRSCRFLDRFDRLLPKYQVRLPVAMFQALKKAYFARNGVIHGLRPVSAEEAQDHLRVIENIMIWYWKNVGSGASQLLAHNGIPF